MSPGAGGDEGQRPLLAGRPSSSIGEDDARDYGSNAQSLREEQPVQRRRFESTLGTGAAYGILIGIVIGSGIFTSPGSIDTNVPSPGMALVMWLVGGILVWTGAATFAELGTAIPGEGGIQPYLQHIYGDTLGFLAAWTWVVAVMPATLAILSIVFVESAYSTAGITGDAGRIEHKLLSILVLIIMSVANTISTKATTRLNSFFVFMKFASIVAIVVAGLAVIVLNQSNPDRPFGGNDWFSRPWFGYRNSVNPDGTVTHWSSLSSWEMLGHFSAAIYGALWAYSGWDKAIYISAEMSNPAKQLPLAQNTAIPTIIACFLAANAAYYVLLPWDMVSTTDSIAVLAMRLLLGPGVGVLSSILICTVVAGSLLGNSFVASRMAVSAANKSWLPAILAVVGHIGAEPKSDLLSQESRSPSNRDNKTTSDAPINAVILSIIITTLYILFGSFRALLTLNGLGEYSFFFLAVLGALVLRYREPHLHRPYKPFIGFPVVFVVVSGFVIVRGAVFAPVQAAVLVGVWLVGLLFYAVRNWRRERSHEVFLVEPQNGATEQS